MPFSRILELTALWNSILYGNISHLHGDGTSCLLLKSGKDLFEKLSGEGHVFIKDSINDTVNAIYGYLLQTGLYAKARSEEVFNPQNGEAGLVFTEVWPEGAGPEAMLEGDARADLSFNLIRYALNKGFGAGLEVIGMEPDGPSAIRTRVRVYPIKSGAMAGPFLLMEEKCAELRRAHWLGKVVEMSTDAIVTADGEGKITFWNQAAERLFGYSREEAVGVPVTIVIPDEYRERHRKGFKRFLETGMGGLIGKVTAVEAIRKNGERVPVEVSLSAEKMEGRWVFTAILRDITERKKLEENLKQRLLELERLNKIMVGRELRMEELRQEIRALKEKSDEGAG